MLLSGRLRKNANFKRRQIIISLSHRRRTTWSLGDFRRRRHVLECSPRRCSPYLPAYLIHSTHLPWILRGYRFYLVIVSHHHLSPQRQPGKDTYTRYSRWSETSSWTRVQCGRRTLFPQLSLRFSNWVGWFCSLECGYALSFICGDGWKYWSRVSWVSGASD